MKLIRNSNTYSHQMTDYYYNYKLRLLAASNDGKEHVESNLDSVDKDQTMLSRDEFEVDSMDDWPNLPRSLTGGK